MSISSTIRAGAAYVEVTADTGKLRRNLNSAQAQLQSFGRACTTVGRDMLLLSGALASPLVMAAKSFAGFDDSMRLVQAVTQATEEDFKALTKTAQRLGRDTSYTAQQAADAMVSLGRMGFTPAEIQASIDAVLNLARSTGTDLAEAGDIAANSMRIFGIEASKMGDVADVMTVTANSSAQTLTDLFEALKMGGPQAAAAGENIRETSAAIAVLANMGIKGSLAGTALRKSFSQFAKVKVQEQLKAVGVETLDSNGNLRKMAEIMRDIAKVIQTMPTGEKLAFAEDIFDIRGSLAGLTLTANTDELDAMLTKLQDVEGVAAKTATAMDAGLGGAFRLLMSAVEGSLNAIADAMNSTLQPMIQKITAVINAMTGWIEAHAGLVTAFAVTVAGAAGLGAALVAVGVVAKGAAAGIAVIQGAITAFNFVQGMCVAKLSTLFSAFANYRNTAIPALVATEQLCSVFKVAGTTASRTAASIILMSNAEAAAAARSALAAKWTAMTAALKSFWQTAVTATVATKAQAAAELALAGKNAVIAAWNGMTTAIRNMTLATVTATVATKAHAATEAVCTLGTMALNKVRQAGIAVTALFTAANLKSAVAISAVAAGNFLLATAAKAAAVAMLGLAAVMSAIAAHPVLAALIALGLVVAGVSYAMYRSSRYTAQLSDKMGKLREQNDELRKTDEVRMERLQQLAARQKLTNAEMAEAISLAGKLQKKYGDLGIAITGNSVRISQLDSAVSRLGELELKVTNGEDLTKLQRLESLSLKVNLSVPEQTEASSLIEDLSAKYGNLGIKVDGANKRIIALNSTAQRVKSVQMSVAVKAEDMPKFEQLHDLSMKVNLTVAEQGDAESLISELTARYGDMGVTVDRTAGRIARLNSVAASIREISAKVSGTEDKEKAVRLQKLAVLPKLDASGIAEADTLISQLSAKYGSIGLAVDKATARIVAMTEAQRAFANAANVIQAGNEPSKAENLASLERLKKLAEQERLSAAEQQEAQSIVAGLNSAYNGLGLNLDTITGKLNIAATAQNKLNDAMKRAAIADIDAEIAEQEANIHELQKENEALLSYGNHNLMSRITGRQAEAVGKIEVNGERAAAYRQRIAALRQRRQAVQEDKSGTTTPEETTAERVAAENRRRQQSHDNADRASKRAAEIDRQLARERQSELQNEIDDITALRDEYKSLIQTMLDFEKSKPEKEQDNKKISNLQGKLSAADTTAEERIAQARQKYADELKKEVDDFRRSFADTRNDVQTRRQEEAQERQIDNTMKNDPSAGLQMIQAAITRYSNAARDAVMQFEQELANAQQDGKITDDERRRINEAQSAYTSAESMLDRYERKLRDAQSGTKEAAEKTKVNGSFLVDALANSLGGGNASERTAKATEQIAENTKENNRLIKRLKTNGSTLTYG